MIKSAQLMFAFFAFVKIKKTELKVFEFVYS